MGADVSLQDALHDLSRIPAKEHADIVCMKTAELLKKNKTPSGVEMERNLLRYMETRDEKDFDKLRLPLSMSQKKACEVTKKGLSKWNPIPHIPENLRWASGNEEWKTALVASPAFTPVHADHIFCGQMMAHLFGHKV